MTGIEGFYKSVDGRLVKLAEGEGVDLSRPWYSVPAEVDDPGTDPSDLSGWPEGWTEVGLAEDKPRIPPAFGPRC